MAGAVFQTYSSRPRRPPAAPDDAAAAVAGPSRQADIELQPMMTPAVWRGDTASSLQNGEESPPTPTPPPLRRPPPLQQQQVPLSHDLILERALPRASHRYGLSQALARSVSLSLALAGLASALYLVTRWREKRGVAGVAIGAVCILKNWSLFYISH